ncbi:MAG: hypothetical protein GC168_19020 [Candidatus Hydrogenedens sp.]|nr:hypothetical protein [Candidatus Hydrogenedens sp.]
MSDKMVSRRDFSRLTAAAVGGVMGAAGLAYAAGDKEMKDGKKGPKIMVDPALLLADKNVCRGLNMCNGHGKGDHACAGHGACASVEAHACNGMNECKGQGGCGGYPGQNACKGKGECAVPLKDDTWDIARKQFEKLMKDNGKAVGAAPAK